MPENTAEKQSLEEYFEILRKQTVEHNQLYEAQEYQLKYWPLMALPHLKSSEYAVTFENKSLEFRFKLDPKVEAPEDIQKRLEIIDNNVKWMLGDDWLVRFKANGKLLYRGMRKTDDTRPKGATDSGKQK